MSSSPTQTNPYYNSLDGLRLLASLNIAIFHLEILGGLADLKGYPGWFFTLVKGPAFTASLFFVLGGFIMAHRYSSQARTLQLAPFLKSRFKQLYPLHIILVLSMGLLAYFKVNESLPKIALSVVAHGSLTWSLFPFYTLPLNRPSWALSAFFFIYLFFPQLLRAINRIRRTDILITLACFSLVPLFFWGLIYADGTYTSDRYQFFHGFAPIRIFEFILGVLLYRWRILSLAPSKIFPGKSEALPLLNLPLPPMLKKIFFRSIQLIRYDFLLITLFAIQLILIRLPLKPGALADWIAYHIGPPVLFCFMILVLAEGKGLISSFLSLKPIRIMGQASFYPYLLHIPLTGWACYIAETYFNYYKLLHHPLSVSLILVALYIVPAFVLHLWKVQKKARIKSQAHL